LRLLLWLVDGDREIARDCAAGYWGGVTALMNPCLRTFWEAKRNDKGERVRQRILYGGRSSSKTWDAAAFAIWIADNFSIRFLCVRQFQAKIDDSVLTVLKNTIDRFARAGKTQLSDWQILENKIRNRRTGSEFVFYGLWRHIREIKGLEGIDICWIEEAEALTEEQWRILNPTLRNDFSQFWVIFNPNLVTDFVWQRMVERPLPGTLIRSINFDENPFLSDTMKDVIAADYADDPEEADHIYGGKPRADDDDAVIKRSWALAAVDAHILLGIQPSGWKRIGFDVADKGKDKCAMIYAHGPLASWSDLWKAHENEGMKSSRRAWNAAGERDAQIIYDNIGVGASVGAHINSFNEKDEYGRPSPYTIRHMGFNAGGPVWRPESRYGMTKKTNLEMFANLKAQSWWHVADLFRNTFNEVTAFKLAQETGQPYIPRHDQSDMIFIDSNIDNLGLLITELSTPRRDFDNAGKVKVESKADMQKSNRPGGPAPSPNCADGLIMCFAPGQRPMTISAEAVEEVY
jgi:phage terminase large subunit